MLRRIVVISDDSPGSGGAASIVLASLRQLVQFGVPTTLLTGDSCRSPDIVRLGIEFSSLGGRHILDGSRAAMALRGLYDCTVSDTLMRWISANDGPGTIYHLHNWHKYLSASVFAALRRVSKRLIISAHDFFLACPNGGYYIFPAQSACHLRPMSLGCLTVNCDKRLYMHKVWRTARHVLRQCIFDLRDTPATVLAVHEKMVPLLERGGISRRAIQVLRNPVTPWCSTRVNAERNGEILYVGRLELDKGADMLARAARDVQRPLKFVGGGPLTDLIRASHQRAEVLGQLSRGDVAKVASRARIVVLPTRVRETFGLVALEASMSGIPVISSNSALITDELVGLGCGRSCEADDEAELSRAISALIEDDAAVARMSRIGFEGARQLAPTEADWGRSLLELYERKLSSANS
jgi:glycosyltransferase involved in cell wall biosynthesis